MIGFLFRIFTYTVTMKNLEVISHPLVQKKLESYPEEIQNKLGYMRSLIIQVAVESESIKRLEETLKWGEPSYLARKGSTVRVDWKINNPNQYAIYFKCTSLLVPTFREVYGDIFRYEKNRAIIFHMEDEVPEKELKTCIKVALHYHSLKKLPLLGITV